MKAKIFNAYKEDVCELFDVTEEELFTKSKLRDVVDARHLLYYLCKTRPMRIVYIKERMALNNYKIAHTSIIHGIKMVEKKLSTDKDYIKSINKIRNKCTL